MYWPLKALNILLLLLSSSTLWFCGVQACLCNSWLCLENLANIFGDSIEIFACFQLRWSGWDLYILFVFHFFVFSVHFFSLLVWTVRCVWSLDSSPAVALCVLSLFCSSANRCACVKGGLCFVVSRPHPVGALMGTKVHPHLPSLSLLGSFGEVIHTWLDTLTTAPSRKKELQHGKGR